MGFDIPEALVHIHREEDAEECVVRGKDPITVSEKVEVAIKMHPELDTIDLIQKMEKDVGVWITEVRSDDGIIEVEYPRGWSTGCTALHLASRENYKEIYFIGFDLSSYDKPLNNIYKGSENYLPADTKGFNPVNWVQQMETTFAEFPEVQYYWVDAQVEDFKHFPNVGYLTKDDLCDKLKIV